MFKILQVSLTLVMIQFSVARCTNAASICPVGLRIDSHCMIESITNDHFKKNEDINNEFSLDKNSTQQRNESANNNTENTFCEINASGNTECSDVPYSSIEAKNGEKIAALGTQQYKQRNRELQKCNGDWICIAAVYGKYGAISYGQEQSFNAGCAKAVIIDTAIDTAQGVLSIIKNLDKLPETARFISLVLRDGDFRNAIANQIGEQTLKHITDNWSKVEKATKIGGYANNFEAGRGFCTLAMNVGETIFALIGAGKLTVKLASKLKTVGGNLGKRIIAHGEKLALKRKVLLPSVPPVALLDYMNSSNNVNGYLRGIREGNSFILRQIDELDSFLPKLPSVKVKLTRAVEAKYIPNNWKKVGTKVTHNEYISASLKGNSFTYPNRSYIVYDCGKTLRCRDITKYNPIEKEVIIQRGSQGTVTGYKQIKQRDGTLVDVYTVTINN